MRMVARSRSIQLICTFAVVASATVFVYRKVWAATPVTVTVAVTVSNSGGGTLSYQWRSTDGTITNVNAPSTTWTLPDGPGLHFAYVLVSNGKGGFTERRVAVNTDTIGNPPVTPPPVTLTPPAAAAASGNFYRSFTKWGFIKSLNRDVKIPNIPEFVEDSSTAKHYPSTGTISTNLKGQFTIAGVPVLSAFTTHCSVDGGAVFDDCTTNGPTVINMPNVATTDYVYGTPSSFPAVIAGSLALADGTPCGTLNECFNVHVTATATLLDASKIKLAGPVNLNDLGDYALPYNVNATTVQLKCQGAPLVNVAVVGLNPIGVTDLGQATLSGIKAPVVSNMTAMLGSSSVGLFLTPTTGQPSDIVPRSDAFLAEKGLDSRVQACAYYLSIGAVSSCSSTGDLVGAISFNDWQRMVKIGKFASGATEYKATYINKIDLNLAREHHSIS